MMNIQFPSVIKARAKKVRWVSILQSFFLYTFYIESKKSESRGSTKLYIKGKRGGLHRVLLAHSQKIWMQRLREKEYISVAQRYCDSVQC